MGTAERARPVGSLHRGYTEAARRLGGRTQSSRADVGPADLDDVLDAAPSSA